MIKDTKTWVGRLKASSLALLLVLSLVCSLLISPLANAASDHGIRTTTSLTLYGHNELQDCSTEQRDVTLGWSDFFSTDTSNPLSYKNTFNYQSGYDNARVYQDEFAARFQANLATGSGWAVGQETHAGTGVGDQVSIYLFDPNANLYIDNGMSGMIAVDGGAVWKHTMAFNPNAGCRYQDYSYNHGGSNIHTMISNETSPLLFIASDNINYPSDYAGSQIPTQNVPNEKVYPEIEYTVENKEITLRYTGNLGGCSVVWGYQGESEGDPLITIQKPSADPHIIIVDEYKKYHILVDLKYFGPPAICDPFPPDKDVSVLTFTLDITGSDFSGNTGDMDCSTVGSHTSCLVPSPFEDCSVYGADLIGGFGCVVRNFGVALSILLKTLFVPNQSVMIQKTNNLRDGFNGQMGFLLAPFAFLAGILQATIDTPVSSGCSIHLGNVFGNDSTIDPCTLSDRIPLLFDFLRTVIQAGVLFMVMSGLMAKYHEVLKA